MLLKETIQKEIDSYGLSLSDFLESSECAEKIKAWMPLEDEDGFIIKRDGMWKKPFPIFCVKLLQTLFEKLANGEVPIFLHEIDSRDIMELLHIEDIPAQRIGAIDPKERSAACEACADIIRLVEEDLSAETYILKCSRDGKTTTDVRVCQIILKIMLKILSQKGDLLISVSPSTSIEGASYMLDEGVDHIPQLMKKKGSSWMLPPLKSLRICDLIDYKKNRDCCDEMWRDEFDLQDGIQHESYPVQLQKRLEFLTQWGDPSDERSNKTRQYDLYLCMKAIGQLFFDYFQEHLNEAKACGILYKNQLAKALVYIKTYYFNYVNEHVRGCCWSAFKDIEDMNAFNSMFGDIVGYLPVDEVKSYMDKNR